MSREAIILAGGLGTRLRSKVNNVPKCMAPVAGKPFLWYMLKYLADYQITKVVLSVGYLRDVIIEWIDGNRNEFPYDFDFAIETEPLGTGGGIKLALEKIQSENALVLNGDTFFNVNIDELYEQHRLLPSYITLALKPMSNFDRYGNVKIDVSNRILKFEEKKYHENGLINGGVYLIKKEIFKNTRSYSKFSFETDVLPDACSSGWVYGVKQDGYFIDIGIPDDYDKANEDFKAFLRK